MSDPMISKLRRRFLKAFRTPPDLRVVAGIGRRAYRRRSWLFDNMSARKSINLLLNCGGFLLGSSRLPTLPSIVKVDISPVCALQCLFCLHADPAGRDKPLLAGQTFRRSDRMDSAEFRQLIDGLGGSSLAVSLFYYGDPLVHPNLEELCAIARSAGLNVHLTTHFSYNLSDERIAKLTDCGVTHITVALDGASQEIYGRTRIRGRLDWVVSNLRRLIAHREAKRRSYPVVEVQYIAHHHHPDGEEGRVKAIAEACAADQFKRISPSPVDNIVDEDLSPRPARSKGLVPRCHWPYTSMVVKHDGDVIPCCNHRASQQFVEGGDKRVLGNVFKTPVKEIWNSEAYQAIRRVVEDPSLLDRDPAYRNSFCSGCPVLMKPSAVTEISVDGLALAQAEAGPQIVLGNGAR
jgi:radical SAM protein with 4Fe4S-binding SPASM domain